MHSICNMFKHERLAWSRQQRRRGVRCSASVRGMGFRATSAWLLCATGLGRCAARSAATAAQLFALSRPGIRSGQIAERSSRCAAAVFRDARARLAAVPGPRLRQRQISPHSVRAVTPQPLLLPLERIVKSVQLRAPLSITPDSPPRPPKPRMATLLLPLPPRLPSVGVMTTSRRLLCLLVELAAHLYRMGCHSARRRASG